MQPREYSQVNKWDFKADLNKPPYPFLSRVNKYCMVILRGHFWDTCIIHTKSFLCDKKNYVRQKAIGPWIICLLVVSSAAASAVRPAIHFVNIFSQALHIIHNYCQSWKWVTWPTWPISQLTRDSRDPWPMTWLLTSHCHSVTFAYHRTGKEVSMRFRFRTVPTPSP